MTAVSRRRLLVFAAVFITAVYLIPVYWMVNTSFKGAEDIFATPPDLLPLPPTFGSYADAVFSNGDIARGLMNSGIIAVGTTVVTLLVALPAAYALARLKVRFVSAFLMLFLAVQMVPSVNLALPMFVLFSGAGLVNSYAGLIIANCSLAVPLAITILRPYFLAIPEEIVEAAKIDGCNELTAFWRVAVPVSTPGIITVGAVSFLQAWGEFVFGLALAPDERFQPVTVVLAGITNAFGTKWNDLMAVSAIIALPVIVLFIFLQRYIVAGLTEGATKS
ncbi:multiple sugar transport system permease protein [Nocardioides albertanoniae]|uniref:Multiple sugar transport system permease protein n=1 Tax=Nocardioides albertanoniae TaxID=1175486 RepID=A0A543ADC3_9ACTN|nr:carbohydrate ABC transporter permease [Nocardioides albertanoniae]TQL70577.1 multiple sugar transport system permease protein [Nocardioides albertanoniae]